MGANLLRCTAVRLDMQTYRKSRVKGQSSCFALTFFPLSVTDPAQLVREEQSPRFMLFTSFFRVYSNFKLYRVVAITERAAFKIVVFEGAAC